ncbi:MULTISPECIES: hypothetical protein [unclassified Sedimentibacter]|uniref:hypothetical protein n=1 Tax=unclassified Sedimentibacter TaxID=2649220 RepID=UPI0027E136C7|nr:hypothetical protein [Sedimentibacter sp. MB35-C1]WMJ77792.1 hypothetical protein RBQ61_02355 [Sedimentibacter sp. MB35-C1]
MYENSIQINERNYNLIISNLILSQTEKFTYNDIIKKLGDMFEEITIKIENIVERCLIRLREDGFLSVLGSSYAVVEISL